MLKHLDISCNEIADEAAVAIASATVSKTIHLSNICF